MKKILPLVEQKTSGYSYASHKFCMEARPELPGIRYEDEKGQILIKRHGETDYSITNARDLSGFAKRISQNEPPIFRYFLDGSRRTYKVDDMAYNKRVFPIIAGQIGVGCCIRESSSKFRSCEFRNSLLLTLPKLASTDSRNRALFFDQLKEEINREILKAKGLSLSKIVGYDNSKAEKGERIENRGIAMIQEEMYNAEQEIVSKLASKNWLGPENWMLKDGSLEYRTASGEYRDLSKIKSNYNHVIGVSKSFNPERVKDKDKRSIAQKIADLRLFHRTPAVMQSTSQGVLSVWYLRIRERKFSVSPFDGVIKVEKILVFPREKEKGMETQLVDLISANLINERNPVGYGSDLRWANHLYPVYLTEQFIKSKYLSDRYILNLF